MSVSTSPAGGGNAVDTGQSAKTPEPQVEHLSLTIDGVEVQVPKGTLVIRAAEEIGVQIPRFCDHPLLDPVGACRQCLVEVSQPDREGNLKPMPKPQASCTLEVAEGMVVNTQHTSQTAEKAQAGVMELLLINHPLDCPVCDKGGECPLQNQAMSAGRAISRFVDVKRTYPKPINISSQVLLDRERCVLCARCTRFSDQIAGDPFIAMIERGALQQVGIYEEQPFSSYYSGNTVQICPVGALTGSAYRFRSRPFDLVSTPSVCEHCADGCNQRTDHRRGVVLRRMALENPAVNEEWNCDKGRWAFTYAQTKRITEPLIRDAEGRLQVASWGEALRAAADGLGVSRQTSGVGVLPGGRVSVEDAYAYSKFARTVLGTNDIDFRSRPQSVEEQQFLASDVAGTAADRVTYTDLERAKAVLLVGLETEDESPMILLRLRKAVRAEKLRVFSVGSHVTRGLEKSVGTLVPAVPGREAEVLHALGVATGQVSTVAQPDQTSAIPVDEQFAGGLTGDPVHEAASLLGPQAVILVGERMATSPGALSAVAELSRTTGARLAWVPARAGDRGALEAGAVPALLPGGRRVALPEARAEVADVWGVDPESLPVGGRDAVRILADAAAGELGSLLIGGVELRDCPDPALAQRAVQRAFVVSLETRESDLMPYADVVLPVAPAQEKAGTFLTWEGRPQNSERAIDSGAMSDFRVLDLVASEMGDFLGARTLEEVRAERADLAPRAPQRPEPPQVALPQSGPLGPGEAVLATWKQLLGTGALQENEPWLAGTRRAAVVQVDPEFAVQLGIGDGEALTLSTDRGTVTLPAMVAAVAASRKDRPVIWAPGNTEAADLRSDLGAHHGDVLRVSRGGVL